MLFPTIHNLYEVNALVEKEHEVEEVEFTKTCTMPPFKAYVMPK